ncbi:MAG: hypothetical protein IT452_10890 [Planctomycetia bacterium]|nr:hypothetical protein [Planctomycetia bacterium]
MTPATLDPTPILQTAFGFWNSKVLLTAVEMGVFTRLGPSGRQSGADLGKALGLHPRGISDFLDALVAMKFLGRDGDGPRSLAFNTPEGALFLDEKSPVPILGRRPSSGSRREKRATASGRGERSAAAAVRGGAKRGPAADGARFSRPLQPQNEEKYGQKGIFEALYPDPAKLEQFLGAMTGLSRINFEAFAARFDFTKYKTLCDVSGATGLLAIEVAKRLPHMTCTSFDLPAVAPVAKKCIAAGGVSEFCRSRGAA